MREIEFRAWDKVNKKMHKENELITLQHKEGGCTYPNIYIHGELPLIYCFGRSIEIMQFTGLLDCNGVKIFEGDILHFLDPLDYKPFVVEFKDGAFRVAIGKWSMVLDELYIKSSELVVIGNTHQNSELLK